MSEAKDPSLLTPEELAALVEASGTGSIGGIAAIEARMLHELSLSASHSAKHLSTLAETQSTGKTFAFSIDQNSISAFGSAVGAGASQLLQPQISQNSQQIKDMSDRLDHASTRLNNTENELSNIHHTLRLTGEHLQRLQQQEVMAERLQEIRGEVVALIAAEYDQRFAQLQTNYEALASELAELKEIIHHLRTAGPSPGPTQPTADRQGRGRSQS